MSIHPCKEPIIRVMQMPVLGWYSDVGALSSSLDGNGDAGDCGDGIPTADDTSSSDDG